MNLFSKFKETASSVLPVMAIVLFLGLTVAPLGALMIGKFIVGGILLIVGLTFFLLGVDIGIQPIGEQVGSALVKKRNLFLLLTVSFFIGFLVTIAEPDIQVFGDQIHNAISSVDKMQLVLMISLGVGIFIVIGLVRSVFQLPLKIVLLICYILLFLLTFFTSSVFQGIAFDSGGATTGPMTVPFILALGVGVCSVKANSKNDDSSENSFGLTGITSIGPITAVLVYGIYLKLSGRLAASESFEKIENAEEGFEVFLNLFPSVAKEAFLSILPLVVMLVIFQIFLLKLPPRKLMRIFIGLLWSFIGLTIFLVGVNGGFMSAGQKLGMILGQKSQEFGSLYKIILIITGFVLGAVVVCAEPAVWVLTEQVESLSGGTIKRKFMLIFLSIGAAIAIGLTMIRGIFGFNLMYIIVPGYVIALLLMIWCPETFTAIAFDSGGVASGPITSTFVLSFALGSNSGAGGISDGFGVIALVAMTPLIAIQILGIIYNVKSKRIKKEVQVLNERNL